jgi:peptidoglycan/LPS O-acetylase OafA/YrhL
LILAFGLSAALPFRQEWIVQNPLTFGYAAMVTMVAIRLPDIRNRGVEFLAWVGENSYYIYLAQMLFFVGALPYLLTNAVPPAGIILCALTASIIGGVIYGYALDRLVFSTRSDFFSKMMQP